MFPIKYLHLKFSCFCLVTYTYSKLHKGEAFNISQIIFSQDFELNQSASKDQVFLSDASVALLLEEN